MVWKEEEHPRDKYGRFTDSGVTEGWARWLSNDLRELTSEQNNIPITQISNESIDKIPFAYIDGFTYEQCKQIHMYHKALLQYARDNNGSNEVAFIFRKNLSEIIVLKGTDNGVDIGYSINNKGDGLSVMHNHPRNTGFSHFDVFEFLTNDSISHMSVVTNNGKLQIISKNHNFNKKILLIEYQRALKSANKRELKFIDNFLAKLQRKGEILWTKK